MKILSFIMISILVLTGCSNIFDPVSNKETDAAVYEDARKAINRQQYDIAIAKLESLPASFQDQNDFKEMLAGAYAGKCGLNFIDYFTAIGSADLSSSTVFKYFMNAFTDRAVSPDFCRKAQLKMEEISEDSTLRTGSQNMFMAILGMVKVGTYLRADADRDGTNGLGDGDADIPPLNICDATETASEPDGWISDDELDEVITGMGLILDNILTLTGVSADLTDTINDLNAACGAACSKTKKSDVNASDRATFRDLLNTAPNNPTLPMGIGNCTNVNPTTCC